MIISVSRRTDIPAFYGEWFIKRIEEGYFYRINPFNSKQIKRYSLEPEDVDAFVFWTKNPKPFMKYLDLLDSKGYKYYFHFTLNNYPHLFEPKLPEINERINTFISLSERIGKEKLIWRYDPIIISSITPIEYHKENISYLFDQMHNYTNRLTISFVDYYGKVENRIKKLQAKQDISFEDITNEMHIKKLSDLAKNIVETAVKYNIEVVTCSEKVELQHLGINRGSCIDGELINNISGTDEKIKLFKKDKNQRSECLCVESVDMGMYNSCSHMCIYCYANYSEKTIENNKRRHRLESPILIGNFIEN